MQQPTLLDLPEDILCRVCELCASSQPGAVAALDALALTCHATRAALDKTFILDFLKKGELSDKIKAAEKELEGASKALDAARKRDLCALAVEVSHAKEVATGLAAPAPAPG